MDLFIPQTEENYVALAMVAAFVGEHREITANPSGITIHGVSGEEEKAAILESIQRFTDNPVRRF